MINFFFSFIEMPERGYFNKILMNMGHTIWVCAQRIESRVYFGLNSSHINRRNEKSTIMMQVRNLTGCETPWYIRLILIHENWFFSSFRSFILPFRLFSTNFYMSIQSIFLFPFKFCNFDSLFVIFNFHLFAFVWYRCVWVSFYLFFLLCP